MRILYFADIRFPLERANGIQTVQTCWALAARGHEVRLRVRPDTAASPGRDPFTFYGLPPLDRLRIDRAPAGGPPALARAGYLTAALALTLKASAQDVILTRDLGVAAAIVRIPRRLRAPLVYESHGFAPVVSAALPDLLSGAAAPSAAKQARLEARERSVWTRADGYVTITRALADDLVERFGPRTHVAIVPDGVRLATDRAFAPFAPGPTPVVGYSGHLYPWKGADVLIRALAALPEVSGLIIGGHPQEGDLGRLQALAQSLGSADRVVFTGLLAPSEVAGRLRHADILALPNTATTISQRYTSPLKLFEYLAAGKPIVASRLPAIGEVLRDGENALLVDPGSPEALAEAVRRLLEHPALGTRLARQAFDEATRYSWAVRAEALDALLAGVTGRGTPARERVA